MPSSSVRIGCALFVVAGISPLSGCSDGGTAVLEFGESDPLNGGMRPIPASLRVSVDERFGQFGELRLESNTLTPMLKRLEGQGLVSRKRDRKDERRVLIRVTAKGRALQEQAARIPASLVERVGLPLEDLTRLRDELHDLRDRLLRAGEEG